MTDANHGNRILRPRAVINKIGLSRTTLWRKVRRGEFPQPIQLTEGGAIGFYESEIEEWLDSRSRCNYAGPAQGGTP